MAEAAGSLDICMAQKANMEAIFHSVADGIVTLDNDMRVVHVNRAAEAMLGASEAAVSGEPVAEVLRGRTGSVAAVLERTREAGAAVREQECVLVTGEDREVRVQVTASLLYDRDDSIGGAVVVLRDVTHLRALEEALAQRAGLHSITGKSHAMQEIYRLIEQVAPTESTVLIQGESGTGKELIADAIHRSSARADGPFVKVNCSALSEGLLESELFGHVKGAFTGATHDRAGRFELADGGTLLLDEIGDLSERIQVKLLRVLQEREIERVGDSRVRKVNVRILAATHRSLRQLVDDGRFREDLYYRLHVIPIHVPPLRERREDIPLLMDFFLEELKGAVGKSVDGISAGAMRVVMDHRFPGNVRELRNAVEHALVKCHGDMVLVEDLPRELVEAVRGATGALEVELGADERSRIVETLKRAGGSRTEAARLLGINRSTLWRKMRRLGI